MQVMPTRIRPLPLAAGLTGFFFATLTTRFISTQRGPTAPSSPVPNMSSQKTSWPVRSYTPRQRTWPYTAQDFRRQDNSPDPSFYSSPRFVTHIDDAAIATLREYYATVLPTAPGSRTLDFCSSWISHYPEQVENSVQNGEVKVVGLGMNKRELEANKVLNGGWAMGDLNEKPDLGQVLKDGGIGASDLFDVATNVVSTDYLTKPVEVLESLKKITKPGGRVHLVISNRCFPTKAIGRWLRVDEEERLQMVGDFLFFAGWEDIEIVELSDGVIRDAGTEGQGGGDEGLKGFMKMMGMGSGRRDPLWVVRGTKISE
ncbi:hypothetical protein CBER1_07525 [Cercospora berteroae]|uniref:Methyltransferase type 11 domain-containing protein n=1 Tax=Cercospora berteroae TaxID=357750 RepID=A0A2S6BU86_9PEZI|nr:hypothetical protein CBER1_07525 [Cercospora berteroae]